MEILSTTTTRTGEETVGDANYSLEYTDQDGVLQRLKVTIFEVSGDDGSMRYYGTMNYDMEQVSCNLPFQPDFPHYIEVLIHYVNTIKYELEQKKLS